jgi:hypothetical protein
MYKIKGGREKVRDLELTDGIHITVILFRLIPSPVLNLEERELAIQLQFVSY